MSDETRQHYKLATGKGLDSPPKEAGRAQGYAKGGSVSHGKHGAPGHGSHGHTHTKKMHRG